jgi:hypothetical protein
MVVFCQVPKAEHNALFMTKIFNLLPLVHISDNNKKEVSHLT